MRNLVSTYVDQFRQDRQKQIKLAAVLAALAVIVAGVVFWQLHSTGVAMTNEVFCGMEEHVHDDSCYEQVLLCGLEESEPVEGHVHNDACYETVETLACQDESEDHVHTEECYVTEQNLICGLEESEGIEGHVHSDACYETVLTCEIPEHTHTIDCMVDEEADVETAEDWEATLPENLSGVWAQDVVSIAESQIGYTESERNFQLADDGETRQGYTRYGAWYGNEYGDWDAMFASFCLNYAGVPEDEFPESSGVYAWTTELGNSGLYVPADKFTPQAGDLAFFDLDEDGQADSVGVISYLSSKDIYVIEGNYEDAVTEQTYDLNDNQIIGYGILPDQPGVEVEPVTLVQQTVEATIYSDASCVDMLSAAENITLSGMMPENASVIAYPVDVSIGDMTILAAYDITIYDETGHEYEPESDQIHVTISNSAIRGVLNGNADPVVYHINDRTDVLEEVSRVSTADGAVEFDAESFSIYIVGENDEYYDLDTDEEVLVYTIYFYEYEFDVDQDPLLISTQYIAENDCPDEPPVPEVYGHHFDGWYTERQIENNVFNGCKYDFPKSVKENLQYWEDNYDYTVNGHEISLYSDFDLLFYVYYEYYTTTTDEDGKILSIEFFENHTDEVRPDENGNFVVDTTTADSLLQAELGGNKAVTAWYDEEPTIDEETGTLIWNGNQVKSGDTIDGDITLYPKIEDVVWIYFTLAEDLEDDVEAAEPVYVIPTDGYDKTVIGDVLPDVSRHGYELVGWWAYLGEEEGEAIYVEATESSTIAELYNEDKGYIDLYAQWEYAEVDYTINIWRQKATDGATGVNQKVVQNGETFDDYIEYYDFAESIHVSADQSQLKTGDTPTADTVYNWSTYTGYGTIASNNNTSAYYGFEYSVATVNDRGQTTGTTTTSATRTLNELATVTMAADGSTVINIYYNRVTVTWTFGSNSSHTLIGLYGTNCAQGTDNAGYYSDWPSAGTNQSWRIGSNGSTVTFEATFVILNNSASVTFQTTSGGSNNYFYYYLEITNENQLDEEKQAEAESYGVEYIRQVEGTWYRYDRRGEGSASSFSITDKYTGYKLDGYNRVTHRNTDSSNSYTETSEGASITVKIGNTYYDLYLFNNARTYSITLESNGKNVGFDENGDQIDNGNEPTYTFKYGQDLTSLELPEELDAELFGPNYYYHFTGTWWEDPTFTARFILPDSMPANNLVAYADWELNEITVTFVSKVDSNLYELLVNIYKPYDEDTNPGGVIDNGDGSYSITLTATEKLNYSLDDGPTPDDPDTYTFMAWINQETQKVFNFDTALYGDTTIEAVWHEEDTFYQIVYVLNQGGTDERYCYGTIHSSGGAAEVRTIDAAFEDLDDYSKFVCWNTRDDGEGLNYYPLDEISWDEIDKESELKYEDGVWHYYLYAKWEVINESTLILHYNYPEGSTTDTEYEDTTITDENLEPIDLAEESKVHSGDEITVNGVTYRFAGWSTSANPTSADDVVIEPDAVVAVDGAFTENSINELYAVWLAEMQFTIVKENDFSERLDDAVFTLTYSSDDITYYYTITGTDDDGDSIYSWVQYDGPEDGAPTITLGEVNFHDSLGSFTGDEEFVLTEISAPTGYLEIESPIVFQFDVINGVVKIISGDYNTSGTLQAVVSGTTLTVFDPSDSFDVYIIKYSGTYESQPPVQGVADGDDDDTPSYISLEGAEFILSRTTASGDPVYAVFDYINDNGWNVYELTDWTEDISKATTLTSDGQGYIEIHNLETGTYILTETKAPDGYMLLDEDIVFTVDSKGKVTVASGNAEVDEYNDSLIAVGNEAGSELPHTGGIGTWIYTIAGVLLIGGAATLLVYRKRRAV